MRVHVTRRDPAEELYEEIMEHPKATRIEVGNDGGVYLLGAVFNAGGGRWVEPQIAGVRDFVSFRLEDQ